MKEISAALSKFQGECPPIEKDSTVRVATKNGGHYEFEYASFGSIVQTIKQYTAKNGLSWSFTSNDTHFKCIVRHISGEFYESSIPMTKLSDQMQEAGSKLTYLKRYTLVLALGLDTDSDDDGNTGEGNERELSHRQRSKSELSTDSQKAANLTKSSKLVTDAQLKRMEAMKNKSKLSWEEITKMMKMRFNKSEYKELLMSEYDELISVIEANTEK